MTNSVTLWLHYRPLAISLAYGSCVSLMACILHVSWCYFIHSQNGVLNDQPIPPTLVPQSLVPQPPQRMASWWGILCALHHHHSALLWFCSDVRMTIAAVITTIIVVGVLICLILHECNVYKQTMRRWNLTIQLRGVNSPLFCYNDLSLLEHFGMILALAQSVPILEDTMIKYPPLFFHYSSSTSPLFSSIMSYITRSNKEQKKVQRNVITPGGLYTGYQENRSA